MTKFVSSAGKKKMILMGIPILAILLLLIAGLAYAASSTTYSNILPADGSTTTNHPRLSAHVTDLDGIKSAYFSVDGTIVQGNITYTPAGQTTVADIWGDASQLSEGSKWTYIRVTDNTNAVSVKSWYINVLGPVVGSTRTPAPGAVTSNGKPQISAQLQGPQANSASSIVMKIDGSAVTPGFDAASGVVSYTPAAGLADGTHTVEISAKYADGVAGTAAWQFNVDATAPVLTEGTPAGTVSSPAFFEPPNYGSLIYGTYKWWFVPNIKWSDSNVDLSTATLKINGVSETGTAQYNEIYDETIDDGYPYYSDLLNGTISGPAREVPAGNYTIEFSISDKAGNKTTKTWTVLYDKYPETVTVTPYYDSNGSPLKPSITATIKDDWGGIIDQSSIKMFLNGQQVPHTYTATSSTQGVISYALLADLPDNSVNRAEVQYADTLGLSTTTTWVFEVSSKGSMVSSSPTTCTSCHVAKGGGSYGQSVAGNNNAAWTPGTFENIHMDVIGYFYSWSDNLWDRRHYCVTCHRVDIGGVIKNPTGIVVSSTAAANATCNVCHYPSDNTPHINNVNWYVYGGVSQQALIKNPRAPYDCEYCHQPYGRWPSKHDISNKHTTNSNEGCDSCHSTSMIREHTGRTDAQGQTITCDTCHNTATTAGSKIFQLYQTADTMSTTLLVDETNPQRAAESAPWGIPGKKVTSLHFRYWGTGTVTVWCYQNGTWQEGSRYDYDLRASAAANNGDLKGTWSFPNTLTVPEGEQIKVKLEVPTGLWGQVVTDNVQLTPESTTPITCTLCHSTSSDHIPPHDNAPTPSAFCVDCHKTNLAVEHQDRGLTCKTCHSSSKAMVKNAITTKNKSCTACHTEDQLAHTTKHTNPALDNACQGCHGNNLSDYHLTKNDKNPDGTVKTDANGNAVKISCNTCHNSTAKKVKRTIANNNLNCAGCHSTGHSVNFADSIPADIPLFGGYSWTTPMEASLFNEPSTPAGYEDGLVLLSNRRADVTAAAVFSYYSGQFETCTLVSGTSLGNYFSAEFAKAGRTIMVKCYNTKTGDGQGAPVAQGYRIEVWYK